MIFVVDFAVLKAFNRKVREDFAQRRSNNQWQSAERF